MAPPELLGDPELEQALPKVSRASATRMSEPDSSRVRWLRFFIERISKR
jgi:hypothetical protein